MPFPSSLQTSDCAEGSTSDIRNVRRALLFAFHFPPSIATGARRPFRFAKYLRTYGYDVHAITSAPQSESSPWLDVTSTSQKPMSGKTRFFSAASARLQRFLPYNDQLPWIAPAVQAAEEFLSNHDVDAIISTSPPLACHLAALEISRRHRIPWIADYRDPLRGNPSRTRNWGWMWDVPLDRLVISHADAVIANTDAAQTMLVKRYPKWQDKIHLIWNGYDPELSLAPLPLPKRNYRLMVHAGSLYGQRHPSAILTSLSRLLSAGAIQSEQFRLRLVGDFNSDEPWIEATEFHKLISQGWVEHTHGMVAAEEAVREMGEADCLLLLDINDRALGLQVPAKLFEYIQIGRPILAFTSRCSPVERILQQSGVPHVCIHPDDPASAVDRGVLTTLQMPSDAVRPSRWFSETFDGCEQTRTLATILRAVRSKTGNGGVPATSHD